MSGMVQIVAIGLTKGGIGSRAGRTKFIRRVFSISYSALVYYSLHSLIHCPDRHVVREMEGPDLLKNRIINENRLRPVIFHLLPPLTVDLTYSIHL